VLDLLVDLICLGLSRALVKQSKYGWRRCWQDTLRHDWHIATYAACSSNASLGSFSGATVLSLLWRSFHQIKIEKSIKAYAVFFAHLASNRDGFNQVFLNKDRFSR